MYTEGCLVSQILTIRFFMLDFCWRFSSMCTNTCEEGSAHGPPSTTPRLLSTTKRAHVQYEISFLGLMFYIQRKRDQPRNRWLDDLDAHCNGWFEAVLEKLLEQLWRSSLPSSGICKDSKKIPGDKRSIGQNFLNIAVCSDTTTNFSNMPHNDET